VLGELISPAQHSCQRRSEVICWVAVLPQCMCSSNELRQGALQSVDMQQVLSKQMDRLKVALEQVTALINKWSKTMILEQAKRFLNASGDKEEIKKVSMILLRWDADKQSSPSVPHGHLHIR
jgi:hypothetical protein